MSKALILAGNGPARSGALATALGEIPAVWTPVEENPQRHPTPTLVEYTEFQIVEDGKGRPYLSIVSHVVSAAALLGVLLFTCY
jgi:hypothetical protein